MKIRSPDRPRACEPDQTPPVPVVRFSEYKGKTVIACDDVDFDQPWYSLCEAFGTIEEDVGRWVTHILIGVNPERCDKKLQTMVRTLAAMRPRNEAEMLAALNTMLLTHMSIEVLQRLAVSPDMASDPMLNVYLRMARVALEQHKLSLRLQKRSREARQDPVLNPNPCKTPPGGHWIE